MLLDNFSRVGGGSKGRCRTCFYISFTYVFILTWGDGSQGGWFSGSTSGTFFVRFLLICKMVFREDGFPGLGEGPAVGCPASPPSGGERLVRRATGASTPQML